MQKIRLLFDVEQLSTDGLKGTGIVRVCDVLLRLLSENKELDVYPIITSKRGDFNNYLKVKGLSEQFADKIVYMPKLKATTKNQGKYQQLRTKLFSKVYFWKYGSILKQYDAYISMFSPISPVVYESGLKTFMVVHDLIPMAYPDGCDPKFVKKFIDWIKRSHPDAYFCVSEYTKKDLIKFKPKAANIPIYKIYLGADNEKFKPIEDAKKIAPVKEKYGIKTPKYFLAVSEITTRKNLVHLLQAFVSFLSDTNSEDISLVLVGPVRKGYVDVAEQVKGLEKYKDKIVQTGFADNEDLAPLYSGATAFVYPSLYEGFGLPVLEAMQCGTPVITCNNTSLPEVGGDAVLYISGKDKNETAMLLNKIYNDESLRQMLKTKGLARAKEFDWQKTAKIVTQNIINTVRKTNHEKTNS
jgi:glycosyltransferase involved in cell wall biosynthesis